MEDCGMGRRQGVAAQRDLFTAAGQVPMLTSVERDKLLADSSLEGNTGAFFSMIGVGDLVQQGVEDLVGSSVSMALARS